MTTKHLHTCMLCESVCGIEVEVDAGRVVRVRGDEQDPFSRGHLCPKAAALEDVRTDPDRVRTPLHRTKDGVAAMSWDAALAETSKRISEIRRRHGPHSVAVYLGNPTVHSHGALMGAGLLLQALGTRSRFSATSLDQLPRMLAALEMFGNQLLLPIPDLDRTAFLLIVGANPVVSNGTLMTAGNVSQRIEAVRSRGGQVVLVDPRRSETAKLADAHHAIRPGTDALLLAAMLHTIFASGKARLGHLTGFTDGLDALTGAVQPFTPELVAPITGINAEATRALALAFANAPSAVCYGGVGSSTQDTGGVCGWLIQALNVVTGNLDRPGGAMFPTPAIDISSLAARVGQTGSFDRFRSRVRQLPEFGGELPTAALAEEIETPGERQIRALITICGNPVLSAPNGPRLERALSRLDYMVSIDIYRNETTRHANMLLPTSFGLERDHYDLVFNALAVRNTVRFAEAVFEPPPGVRHDWQVMTELAVRLGTRTTEGGRWAAAQVARGLRMVGPRRVLDLGLRTGPHRLSLRALKQSPHGIDLGALKPRLPAALCTPRQRIRLAPDRHVDALGKLRDRLEVGCSTGASDALVLIGRRQLRSNNSWMHNSLRLVKGPESCVLLMHPDDAQSRSLTSGDRVRILARVGHVEASLRVSSEVAPGVVSLPHGWGHAGADHPLRVAQAHAGVSLNALTDELRLDPLTATASFSGVTVQVTRATDQHPIRARAEA